MERREGKAADQGTRELAAERDAPGRGKATAARWRAVLKENLEIVVLLVTVFGAGMGTVVGSVRWLKNSLEAQIAEVKHEIAEVKREIAEVKRDLEVEIAEVKRDLEDRIVGLASGTEWRIDTSAGSLQHQIVGLREQVSGMQQQINGMQGQINALQEQLALIALRLPASDSGGGDPNRGPGPDGAPEIGGAAGGAPE